MNTYDKVNWTKWFNLQAPDHQKHYCLEHFVYKGGVTCKQCEEVKDGNEDPV